MNLKNINNFFLLIIFFFLSISCSKTNKNDSSIVLDEVENIETINIIEEENFNKITNFSDSIAAASIAQVHFATINIANENREVAIKILRPNIEKIFNEELDALMLLAYIVESLIKKTKRLKLVEVVQLLREITNVEMDLRFEAAATG